MIAKAIEKAIEDQYSDILDEAASITPDEFVRVDQHQQISDDSVYWTIMFVNTLYLDCACEADCDVTNVMLSFPDCYVPLAQTLAPQGYDPRYLNKLLASAFNAMRHLGMLERGIYAGEFVFMHTEGDKRHRTKPVKQAIKLENQFKKSGMPLIEFNRRRLEALI